MGKFEMAIFFKGRQRFPVVNIVGVIRIFAFSALTLLVGRQKSSGGARPGRARSNDLAGRSTALPIALLR